MYVFYEHHKDARGTIVLTEIKLSSGKDRWYLSTKGHPTEELQFGLTKQCLKAPAVKDRSFDETTKIWSYLNGVGVGVLKSIEIATSVAGGAILIEVEDLATLATEFSFNFKSRRKAQSAEDFFYEHGTITATPKLTKERALELLAPLLATNTEFIKRADSKELKGWYRKAALRLHPDRNGGDGSKMSELNMLWSVYNG